VSSKLTTRPRGWPGEWEDGNPRGVVHTPLPAAAAPSPAPRPLPTSQCASPRRCGTPCVRCGVRPWCAPQRWRPPRLPQIPHRPSIRSSRCCGNQRWIEGSRTNSSLLRIVSCADRPAASHRRRRSQGLSQGLQLRQVSGTWGNRHRRHAGRHNASRATPMAAPSIAPSRLRHQATASGAPWRRPSFPSRCHARCHGPRY
jgi:hypothetical protein